MNFSNDVQVGINDLNAASHVSVGRKAYVLYVSRRAGAVTAFMVRVAK